MKLHTSIPARRNGTVTLTGLDGRAYVFTRDAEGELSASIEHAPTAALLLEGGLFYPADDADYAQALSLTAPANESADEGADEGADEDEGGALPLEAHTPPKPARARSGAKAKARS